MRKLLAAMVLLGAAAAVTLVPLASAACHNIPAPDGTATSVGPARVWGVSVPPTLTGDAGFDVNAAGHTVGAEGDGSAGPPPGGFATVNVDGKGAMASGTLPGIPGVCTHP